MYKIIGGDGKEYGPVDAEALRRWIVEGRLNGRSQAQPEGSGEWKTLAEYPDFASALASQAGNGPAAAGAAPPPMDSEAWAALLLSRAPHIQVSLCLSRSWQLLMSNFGLLFGATAIIWWIG